jgi:L-rhamnose isomerase
MTKTTFYLQELTGGCYTARKVSGYSEGDIGVHKLGNNTWSATHIPTGTKLTPSNYKTAKQALSEAKNSIVAHADYDERVQKTMESESYKAFARSRYEQSVTTVF